MRERLLVVIALAVLAGSIIYAARQTHRQRPLVVQPPVPFSHQRHLAAGLTCAVCHAQAESQAFAGIPAVNDCLECHAGAGVETPLAAQLEPRLRQLRERGEEIPWKQVYRVPGHVYFSHQRHVSHAKLDCAACHGDMSQSTAPPTRQAVTLEMARCMACHRQQRVTTDCLACHR